MIHGTVTADGIPMISLAIAGRDWPATIDTGFNGDLELPEALRAHLNPRFLTQTEWLPAAGQRIVEDLNEMELPFDGQTLSAEATFVPNESILIGTGIMAQHWLAIDFVARTVLLERPT